MKTINVLPKLFSIIMLLKCLEQLKKYFYLQKYLFHIIFYTIINTIINFHEFTKIGNR